MGSFTPPPSTTLAPGDRLDRYELLCVLAQGGMGTVWLARMTGKLGFERLVALKTILQTYSNDRQFGDMFLDEAKIAAQIDHENVARILEIGEDRGILYYAMELIDGESVRKLYRDIRAADTAFPMSVALRIIADACGGLHATHELHGDDGAPLGVVHRDVSPQNLLVSVRGTTKLIDFGVAKANARRSEATEAGTLKGKIEYMAPEQARGDALDRRADVYALGAVLYELLAGRPVRDTDDGKQLAALHDLMTGVAYPPLPETVPELVRNIVDRALARDPTHRFATAEELRRALEQAMLATGQTATVDDVATVLSHFSRERTAKRKDAIERALRAATDGRVNVATIVAPLSARGAAAHLSPSAAGDAGPPDGHGSHPSQAALRAGASAAGGPLVPLAAPSAIDTLQTGPSMRTIGPASMNTQAMAGSSAAKIFAGLLLLGLVALLGVVGGVLVTRRAEHAIVAASPPPSASGTNGEGATGALTGVAVNAAGVLPTGAPGAGVLPVSAEPAAPPTGTTDAAVTTSARTSKDGRALASPSAAKKPGGRPAGKPGAKPGDGDEYGF
jgi:serine/threonine protein kinase